MKIVATLLLIALCAVPSSGQWQKDGGPAADAADRKAVNGFGAHLLVVHDPQKFIEDWQKPDTPRIDNLAAVKRGEMMAAIILFAGCKPDARGVCNAEVDYRIYKPDGKTYGEQKGQPVWKEPPPPAPNIQLARALLGFRIEQRDPSGEYSVRAKVRDLNAGVSFELETKFRVE